MKKLKIFFILLFIILLSGCYKEEGTITIHSDKSVDVEYKVLVDDNFDEKTYMQNFNNYQTRGINIQRINEYGHKGYKISKQYPNLDSISGLSDVTVNLYDFLSDNFNEKYLFKRKEEFFKDTYSAKFLVNTTTLSKSTTKVDTDQYLVEIKDLYSKVLESYANNKSILNYNNKSSNLSVSNTLTYNVSIDKKGNVILLEVKNKNYSYKKVDTKILLNDIVKEDIEINQSDVSDGVMTFVVNLPRKSISNNASRISDDEKTLTWIFNENSSNNTIEFTFDIQNKNHFYIIMETSTLVIICFGILIGISITTKNKKREKREKKTPIYTGYDKSIETEALEQRKNIKHDIINIPVKKEEKTKEEIKKDNGIIEIK